MVKPSLFRTNIKMLMHDMFKLNEFKSLRCSKKSVYILEKLVGTADMSLNSKPKLRNLIFPVYISAKHSLARLVFFFN